MPFHRETEREVDTERERESTHASNWLPSIPASDGSSVTAMSSDRSPDLPDQQDHTSERERGRQSKRVSHVTVTAHRCETMLRKSATTAGSFSSDTRSTAALTSPPAHSERMACGV
jgi:hypothetical protein